MILLKDVTSSASLPNKNEIDLPAKCSSQDQPTSIEDMLLMKTIDPAMILTATRRVSTTHVSGCRIRFGGRGSRVEIFCK